MLLSRTRRAIDPGTRRQQLLDKLLADADLAELRALDQDAEVARAELAAAEAAGIPPAIVEAAGRHARARAEVEKMERKLAEARSALHAASTAHATATEAHGRERAALCRRVYPDHQVATALQVLEAELARDPGEGVHRGRLGAYRSAVARVLAPLRPSLANAGGNGLPGAETPAALLLPAIANARLAGEVAAEHAQAAAERTASRRWMLGV